MLKDLKNIIFSIKRIEKELGVSVIAEKDVQEHINRIEEFAEIMDEIKQSFDSKNLKDECQAGEYLFL